MIVWYFNHYATLPGYGMPGRPYNVARAFIDRGHEAIVFCASYHHLCPQPADSAYINRSTEHDGVPYYCLPARTYRGNSITRLLNILDFKKGLGTLSPAVQSGRLARPDVIIASSPHPFCFTPAYRLARRFSAVLIFEVRDLWPLELIEVARLSSMNPLILWMSHLERQAYRHADAVVSPLRHAIDYMKTRGLSPDRFQYIPNGVSAREWDSSPTPLLPEHQHIVDQIRQTGKLIVMYAGAHGPPNALDQILDLDRQRADNRPYHFILIGDGVSKNQLQERAQKEGIDFVTFLPRLDKPRVRSALLQADIGFICWSDNAIYRFGISPNKIGDYFMAGKPIIHAVNAGNDPVADAQAGISIAPYDPAQLDRALRTFATMGIQKRRALGLQGRQYAIQNLEWSNLGQNYVTLCADLYRDRSAHPAS